MSTLANTISSVFLIDIQIFCGYTYCTAKKGDKNMARSPYIEAYRHQVAVGFTDRQYELLVEHCKKCRVSLSQAVRDAYLEKYPMPNENEK